MTISVIKKLGFIGVGAIARHHARCALDLGAKIVSAASASTDSPNRVAFSAIAGDITWVSDGPALFADPDIDCVVLCAPWDAMEEYLPLALQSPLPVLLEKPIGLSADSIQKCMERHPNNIYNKFVGFNRRFYTTVQQIKNHAQISEIISAEIRISESLDRLVGRFGPKIIHNVLYFSGIHTLDAALYILGPLQIVQTWRGIPFQSGFVPTHAVAETSAGVPIWISVQADDPTPVSIRVRFRDKTHWVLEPLERVTSYTGVEIVEEYGIKRYVPAVGMMFEEHSAFKYGFYEQMRAFLQQDRSVAASLRDAVNVSGIVDQLSTSKP